MGRAPVNLQDTFLNLARKENVEVTIYLVNGVQVRGRVKGFDSYTILLESSGRIQMVYKHAVSTVAPMKRLPNVFNEAMETKEEVTGVEEEEPEEG